MKVLIKYISIVLILLICTSCTKRETDEKNLHNASKEEMSKVYESTKGNEIMIGLWEGPRKHAMKTQAEADARYAEIREAGINMVFIFAELNDDGWLQRTMSAAEKNDIKLIIDLGSVYTNRTAFYDAIDKTKTSKAVIGYNIIDEPSYSLFGNLGNLRNKIKEYVGEDFIVMCNLFPNYVSDSALAEKPGEGMTAYQTYLDSFMQKVKPDILHFDYYPYTSDKSSDSKMIAKMMLNLNDIRNSGAKYNTPTGGFLQSCRWGNYKDEKWVGTRIPNEVEYRFIMNLHLVFGCKTVTNFLYWSRDGSDPEQRVPGYFDGLITYQGERTDVYDIVKKQNDAIHAMKGVYLDYDHKAFMVKNLDEVYINSISNDLLSESYREVNSIESNGEFLVGCFDKDNNTGLYVMNFNLNEQERSDAKFELSECKYYKVWGSEGLVQMGYNDSIVISLLPSEACFIELSDAK